MTKKINTIRQQRIEAETKVTEAEKRVAEIAAIELEAQKEEMNILETAEQNINDVAKLNGLFCGVILTHADLISIFDLALKTGESVKIPFRLYFNE